MRSRPTEELVLVNLLDSDDNCRTTTEVCRALDVGTSVSGRVEVLSVLSSLQDRGLIVDCEGGGGGTRIGYELTERGQSRAEALYGELADHTVEIVDEDGRQSLPVADVPEETTLSSVAAVVERTVSGELRLDEVPEDTFVGRSEELGLIERAAVAAASDGAAVTVVGERGIGKTELLRTAIDRIADDGTAVLPVPCRSDPEEPYGPLREALADHDRDEVFDRTDRPTGSGTLTTHQEALFADVRDAIGSLATTAPALVLIDDLHDASPETTNLVEYLIEDPPAGVLLLVTTRPTEIDQFGDDGSDDRNAPATPDSDSHDDEEPPPRRVRINLDPLAPSETRDLVVRLLEDRSVPESLTDRIHERTGGVPLFVVETVAHLSENGAIDTDAGVYPGRDVDLPIPEDVSDAVEVRLDALGDAARSVLEDAAVLGHEVDPTILAAISDCPIDEIRESLDLLAETGLFESGGDPRFRSEAIREVVLDGIDTDRKRNRHREIATAYEEHVEDPPYAAIARHYECSGQLEAALDAHRTAGDHALDVFANETALEHFERALTVADDVGNEAAVPGILESIGHVHFVTGEYDDAHRYFEYLREKTDDPELIQRSYRYQSEMAEDRGDLDAAERYATAGIEAVEEPNRVTCRLIGHRGWYELQRGNLEAAEEWFHRQHDLAADLDDEDRLAGAHHNLGTLAHRRGDRQTAVEHLERAVDGNEASGATRDAIASYNNLAMVYDDANRTEAAIDAVETAIDLAEEVGDRAIELTLEANLAGYYRQDGELDRAKALVEDVIERGREKGLDSTLGAALTTSGLLLLDRSRLVAARERLESAVNIYDETDAVRMNISARCSLAQLDRYELRLDAAREGIEAALDETEGVEPELEAMVQYHLGDLERTAGNLDAAIEAYERALDCATTTDNVETGAYVRLRLGSATAEATGGSEGIDLAQQATEDAATVGAPLLLSRARVALARCFRFAGDYEAAADALDDADAALGDIDAPLYDSWIAVERALLAADRGDQDAADRLDDAATLAADRGIQMLERRARSALDAL